ncbi:NSFL1 cofactor p47-like [Chrysoperla carnea]|uniref:NSFL1 cofactor p47-like n=1 Tax=Chrysoperla carnea TaxID=189513 RepID=UPI001D07846B|nr:NSFL1 cofactor p47-like [Chrysoperla carnea]
MADNHDSMLGQFTAITGVDAERAKFYLESSAWQVDVALASFYENDNEEQHNAENDDIVESSDVAPTSESSSVPVTKSTGSTPQTEKPKPRKTPNSRFVTVQSLNAANSSDEEEGQAFYAGGSEHSGQQVLGPGKKRDIVDEMFKSVQEHGAEVVETYDNKKGSKIFSGTGYKLGQSSNDTEVITPSTSSSQMTPSDVVLKLWREGFSLNDGPLRAYQDPENRDFLDSVRRGEIPHELIREARGSEVHLNMEDHRHEEFTQVKQKLKPFSGTGHTLGSPAPATVGSPSKEEGDRTVNEEVAKEQVKIDQTQPTTNIQIRLADGSRLIGQFNHVHTVNDVRRYIVLSRPQYQNQEFALLTTFPNRELSDGTQTLDQAGILNAAVMQRLK